MSGAPGGGAYMPCRCRQSGRLTPAARTATRISPGPGSGHGRCSISRTSGPPGSRIATARIVFVIAEKSLYHLS